MGAVLGALPCIAFTACPRARLVVVALWLSQVLEGHIRVRMFGVGRIVEGIVKESLANVSWGGGGEAR